MPLTVPAAEATSLTIATRRAGSTGAASEAAVQKLYQLPEPALIDMGDFVGGMLKYLRTHPVPVLVGCGLLAATADDGPGGGHGPWAGPAALDHPRRVTSAVPRPAGVTRA